MVREEVGKRHQTFELEIGEMLCSVQYKQNRPYKYKERKWYIDDPQVWDQPKAPGLVPRNCRVDDTN